MLAENQRDLLVRLHGGLAGRRHHQVAVGVDTALATAVICGASASATSLVRRGSGLARTLHLEPRAVDAGRIVAGVVGQHERAPPRRSRCSAA